VPLYLKKYEFTTSLFFIPSKYFSKNLFKVLNSSNNFSSDNNIKKEQFSEISETVKLIKPSLISILEFSSFNSYTYEY
jgi:hypothetical protein